MSGFKKESQLLIEYKKADPKTKKDILTGTISTLTQLPLGFDDDAHAAETYKKVFDIYQLIHYVDYTQRIESQQFFNISFDPTPLKELYGTNNDYFEYNAEGHMRLKQLIILIPAEVLKEIRKAQGLDSNLLNAHDIFNTPYSLDSQNFCNEYNYNENVGYILSYAQRVNDSARELAKQYMDAFNEARIEFEQIANKIAHTVKSSENLSKNADPDVAKYFKAEYAKINAHYNEIKTRLSEINQAAIALFKKPGQVKNPDICELPDISIIAMTQTVAWLKGEIPTVTYQDIINNMREHTTTTSSPTMQILLNAMIALCALSVAISLAAVAIPAYGIIAAGAGTANVAIASVAGAGASLFAAGALYTFFADANKQPEQLERPELPKLRKEMADIVKIREDHPEVIGNLISPTMLPF